jgi:hypothetical protein
MPTRRPKPLTAAELQQIQEGWGNDRLVRKLLWEIARLREVVHHSYAYISRLTRYTEDANERAVHGEFDNLFTDEPVVTERRPRTPYESPRGPRWRNMSEEHEATLAAKMDVEIGTREAKRRSRESR